MSVAILRLLGRLPLGVLYVTLSPLLTVLLYWVVRYRRDVVRDNIANSFPDMPVAEQRRLAWRYYRHLGQLTAEILRAQAHSESELLRRVSFKNLDMIERIRAEGKSIMVMALHQSNWEWLLQAGGVVIGPPISVVYKPLHNQAMDQFFLDARTRFHCQCIPHKRLLQGLRKWPRPYFFCLLADQSPMKKSPKAWATMLGQDTAFPLGAEIIAAGTQPVVVFCSMHQTRLGYYEVEFQPLCEPPYPAGEHPILTRYAELATRSISEQPHTWLWSNRRWRFGKSEDQYRGEDHRRV